MAWTNVAKPSSMNYTNMAKPTKSVTIGIGYYTGSLGLTYSTVKTISSTTWVNVNKPGTSAWTNIPKPT